MSSFDPATVRQAVAEFTPLRPQKFQDLIDEYNDGAKPVDLIFAELTALNHQLDAEERRTITENLTEEELALFDLLTKPDLKLTSQE